MTCPVDGVPTADALCGGCENRLAQALGDVDWLMTELDTTLTRQTRTRPARGNPVRDDRPLPYNVRASDTARGLRDLLKDWVSLVAEGLADQGITTTLPTPATAQTLSSWLLHHTRWLATHDTGPDAYTEIVGAVNNIRKTIDIAPDTTFIGPCYSIIDGVECTEILYAIEGHPTVRCRVCGTVWDPRDRALQALRHATTIHQDATTLSRSFTLKGIAIETQRIKNWANRGHLTPAGQSHRRHPTYIVAHVARLIQLHETGQKLSHWPTEQETAS